MRNNKGQFVHNKFLNWRIWAISSTLLFCLVASSYGNAERVYVAEQPQVEAFLVPVVVTPPETIEDKIKEYFPVNWRKMIAIAHAESGMRMEAKGWNCYYSHGVATTTPIKYGSKACKVKDRPLAHSVDCFVLQDNQPGSTHCPQGVTVDEHLKDMAELSKICGLDCWWAYKNGTYLKYMDDKHLAQN